jgi:hypothetical protein
MYLTPAPAGGKLDAWQHLHPLSRAGSDRGIQAGHGIVIG